MAYIVAAGVAGGLLAVAALCGIRGGRGALAVVPGAALGIILGAGVVGLMGLILLAGSIRV
jgi:hypothetical protein